MNRRDLHRPSALALGLLPALATAGFAAPAPELRSGPQPGERPLPFTSNMVTGPFRGQQHCYICDLKDEPAVLVLARRTDEPTGRLLRELRDAVRERKAEKLFGWFVFLGEQGASPEEEMERRAYDFARANGATALPISSLGDPQGPPGYRIAPEVEVTVILIRGGKVLANRAFAARQWSPRAASGALRELLKALGPAAPAR